MFRSRYLLIDQETHCAASGNEPAVLGLKCHPRGSIFWRTVPCRLRYEKAPGRGELSSLPPAAS